MSQEIPPVSPVSYQVPPNSPEDVDQVPNSPYICSCLEDEESLSPSSPKSTSSENSNHHPEQRIDRRPDTPDPRQILNEESKNTLLEVSKRDP